MVTQGNLQCSSFLKNIFLQEMSYKCIFAIWLYFHFDYKASLSCNSLQILPHVTRPLLNQACVLKIYTSVLTCFADKTEWFDNFWIEKTEGIDDGCKWRNTPAKYTRWKWLFICVFVVTLWVYIHSWASWKISPWSDRWFSLPGVHIHSDSESQNITTNTFYTWVHNTIK